MNKSEDHWELSSGELEGLQELLRYLFKLFQTDRQSLIYHTTIYTITEWEPNADTNQSVFAQVIEARVRQIVWVYYTESRHVW